MVWHGTEACMVQRPVSKHFQRDQAQIWVWLILPQKCIITAKWALSPLDRLSYCYTCCIPRAIGFVCTSQKSDLKEKWLVTFDLFEMNCV